MTALTYLAQVRQNPQPQRFKSAWLLVLHVFIMHPFLLTKPREKRGTSRKGIVITGIVRVAAWDEQNRSMGAWLKVAGLWVKSTRYISSRSLAEGRK